MKKQTKFNTEEYLLLSGGTILDVISGKSNSQDILINNGEIIQLGKIDKKDNYHVIDCKNYIITQAFIDIHCHMRVPGTGDQETFISGSNAALAGGYSKICIMPDTNPILDTPELIDFIFDQSTSLPIDIYPIAAITKGLEGSEISEFGSMVNSGAIAVSNAKSPIMNAQVMRYALEYAKMFNIPVINYSEDKNLMNNGVMNESTISNSLGMIGNPTIAESTMIFRDLKIAEYVNGKIHIPNISCSDSIELIDMYRNKDFLLSSSVSPQNIFFTDEQLIDYDTNFKVSPPLRGIEDNNSLIKGIKNGTIDCISSNHTPHRNDDKDKDFYHSESGVIGLETAFSSVHTILKKEKHSIKSIINLFSLNPSKIMNIPLSNIKIGSKAELVIIDENKEWTFKENDIFSQSTNTPFINEKFKGKIKFTINKNILFG